MYCSYCGSKVTKYPANGTCPNCGGPLPPQPEPQHVPQQPQFQQPTIIYQVQAPPVYQVPLQRGINCCGRCLSPNLSYRKKGFNWGLGILGFCLIPFFGILLGYCGSNKKVYTCQSCGFTWTR